MNPTNVERPAAMTTRVRSPLLSLTALLFLTACSVSEAGFGLEDLGSAGSTSFAAGGASTAASGASLEGAVPLPAAGPRRAGSSSSPVEQASPQSVAGLLPPASIGAGDGNSTARAGSSAQVPVLALAPDTEAKRSSSLLSRSPAARALATPARARDGGSRKRRASLFAARSPRSSITVIKPRKRGGVLPGVRDTAELFGIKKDAPNPQAKAFRVASAAGLARLSTNGFIRQTNTVSTECFKPGLVSALKSVERHFGKQVMVTSGYRSPTHNRKAGGAKRSKHVTCEAADIQVAGVSRAKLAAYLRSLPNRGGVGTYCHTKSVHYDIGSERDWSWGCRKKRR